jgi:hypothetical protein
MAGTPSAEKNTLAEEIRLIQNPQQFEMSLTDASSFQQPAASEKSK